MFNRTPWGGGFLPSQKETNMDHHDTATAADLPRAEKIARLNDQLRTTGTGGTLMITQTVRRMTGFRADALLAALASYDGFDADNDPHGERDFGDVTLFGADLLWKVDYYDLDLKYGANDPADPHLTRRVLTVMTAADW